MNHQNIKPEKITKPIQLLSVWLIGLILIVSSLLTAASTTNTPEWLPAFYGISAVCIIPFFLILIFLLQTRFRPQIQEDEYYSKYLDKYTMKVVDKSSPKSDVVDKVKEEVKNYISDSQKEIQEIKNQLESNGNNDKINEILIESDNKISHLEKIVLYSSTSLYINNTLDNYSDIVNTMKKSGFSSHEAFGEDAIPSKFVVAFGKNIAPTLLREVLIELIPLGATYLDYMKDNSEGEKYRNDIIIGSYSFNSYKNTLIDTKILKKIGSLNEKSRLEELVK